MLQTPKAQFEYRVLVPGSSSVREQSKLDAANYMNDAFLPWVSGIVRRIVWQ